MKRYDIINAIIQRENYKSYLEIGVRNPKDCFDRIKCENKTSVDSGVDRVFNFWKYDYEMTSDDFFAIHGRSLENWDIIFIDALHKADQTKKDFFNSINHLKTGGTIVLHDTNPTTEYHTRADFKDFHTNAGEYWNGTVWKFMQFIRQFDCFKITTIDTDWGVTIIQTGKSKPLDKDINPFYEWEIFDNNRKEILNLITLEQWKSIT